jgi:hypothetical protein
MKEIILDSTPRTGHITKLNLLSLLPNPELANWVKLLNYRGDSSHPLPVLGGHHEQIQDPKDL